MRGKNGCKMLFIKLNKALYGCLKSAIIWYETFVTTLKDLGFKLNPYDPCIANLEVNGNQPLLGMWMIRRLVTWIRKWSHGS